MSVTESHVARIIPWRAGVGPFDQSYPSYRWFCHVSITGDASAGVVQADITIEADTKRTSRLWTIEDVDGHKNENAADSTLARLVGFEQDAPDSPDIVRGTAAVLTGANSAFSTLGMVKVKWGFPLHHRPGADLVLTLGFDTNTNGITYRFTAWGWVWEPEASRTFTGPRKPW